MIYSKTFVTFKVIRILVFKQNQKKLIHQLKADGMSFKMMHDLLKCVYYFLSNSNFLKQLQF